MKFHIVRSNEKVDEILFLYNLSLDELKENNKYIKRWDKIPAGTKLRIPEITRNDDLELMEMEPFIEDYYPSLDSVIEKHSYEEKLKDEFKKENEERKLEETKLETEQIQQYNQPVGYYYPIYYTYFPYYNYVPYNYGYYQK